MPSETQHGRIRSTRPGSCGGRAVLDETLKTFVCAVCGEEFECERDGWSEEHAAEEYLRNFGRSAEDPGRAVACDDCYNQLVLG